MKESESLDKHRGSSALRINLVVTSDWINQFLKEQEISVPVTDQYTLTNISIDLGDGQVSVGGDIQEKENSSVRLDCSPIWNSYEQRFFIENLALKTDSNNLLIKSAGWIANTFMGAKFDKKLEEALNQLLSLKRAELIREGVTIPMPNGKGRANVKAISIEDMKFLSTGIALDATVHGKLNLKLGKDTMIIS